MTNDVMKRILIKSLADTTVRLCIKMGYDASQKGLNIEMVINASGDEMSVALTDSLMASLEKIN